MKNNVMLAFSTCPDPEVGRALARGLVESGLAACVNIVPGVTSVYRWNGATHEDAECLLIAKTTDAGFAPLRDWLRTHHPYELPEVITVSVSDGLSAYLRWIDESVTARPMED
jgi:periplasmic divalent cation tolerance protein